jgi:hypothetical protein
MVILEPFTAQHYTLEGPLASLFSRRKPLYVPFPYHKPDTAHKTSVDVMSTTLYSPNTSVKIFCGFSLHYQALSEGMRTQKIGWKNRRTSRRTSFTVTTTFSSIIVMQAGERRFFAEPLDPIQERYLEIRGLPAQVFTYPTAVCLPQPRAHIQSTGGFG